MRPILLALAALALAFTPIRCALAQESTAARRVETWIAAAGGRKVWDGIHDLKYVITTVWYDTTGAELRRRPRYVTIKKVPGAYRVRVERNEASGHYVQVWDGNTAWAALNLRMLDDSTQAVREVRYVTGDLAYWIGLPWKLRDPGVNLNTTADGAVAVTFGSGVGLHDRDRFWYYWRNARSAFPTEVNYIEQGRPENDRQRVLFAEWQKVGSVVFAAKRVTVDARDRPVRALLISAVSANRGVRDALFDRRQLSDSATAPFRERK